MPLSRVVPVRVTPEATPWTSRTTSAWLWLSWMWLQLNTAGAADQVFAGGPTVLTTPVTAVTSQHDDDAAELWLDANPLVGLASDQPHLDHRPAQ